MNGCVLFIPSGAGFAHLGRCLLVANAMRARGYKTHFAYGGAHGHVIDTHGHPRSEVAEVPDTSFARSPLLEYEGDLGRRCVDDEIAAIEATRPVAVVSDLRPTTRISTAVTKTLSVVLKNAALCEDFDHGALFAQETKLQQAARKLTRKVLPLRALGLARGLARLARKFSVQSPRSLFDFFRGDLELICDLTEFAPLVARPPTRHIVGPVIWDGGSGTLTSIEPGEAKGWIYATVGNTGDATLLRTVVDAFGDLAGLQLLLSTGAYHRPEDLGPLPSNVHAYQFVNGAQAVDRCEIVIHCAGDGTTYQCLRGGRPMVAVPFNNDQRVRAYLIRSNRVGVSMLGTPLEVDTLRLAVRTALSNTGIVDNARAFASKGFDGVTKAADVIDSFVNPTDRSNETARHR